MARWFSSTGKGQPVAVNVQGIEDMTFALAIGQSHKQPEASVYAGQLDGNLAIFSFGPHWPIAVRVSPPFESHVNWLVNTGTYSLTTSQHTSAVKRGLERAKFSARFMADGAPTIRTLNTNNGPVDFQLWLHEDAHPLLDEFPVLLADIVETAKAIGRCEDAHEAHIPEMEHDLYQLISRIKLERK